MSDYKIHPLADLNPMMDGDAYERLIEDIKAHGQREPIVMYQGEVLDGRNRMKACLDAGVIPKAREFNPAIEGSAEQFIASMNNRRQMTNDEKKNVVLKYIRLKPTASDRAVARFAGVDHKTVSSVRKSIREGFEEAKAKFAELAEQEQQQFVACYREKLQLLLTQLA